MRFSDRLRIIVLLPSIILVRLAARIDAHAFRYWDVKSLQNWPNLPLRRRAYVRSLAVWGALFVGLFFFLRSLARN